jgi:hypothetical protein
MMLFETKYIVLLVLFSLNLSGGTSIKDNELTDEFDAASDKLHLFSQSSGRLCKGQDWYCKWRYCIFDILPVSLRARAWQPSSECQLMQCSLSNVLLSNGIIALHCNRQ